jgi:eukaryotic-like serine/threonine-protein kinase
MLAPVTELIRLEKQLSAGPDGVRYYGVDPNDEAPVIVERLFLAHRVPERWASLNHRILVACQLQGRGLARLRGYQADGADPYLVTAAPRRTLHEALVEGVDWERALRHLGVLASALAGAHRLGLVHRRLCPSHIDLDDDGEVALNVFGVRTSPAQAIDPIDQACFDFDHPGPEGDVYALAAVAVAVLTGEALNQDDLPNSIRDSSTRLESLLQEMLSADPTARPSMAEVAARLDRSESVTAVSRAGEVVRSVAPPASGATPDQIGRYRPEELLGEGGMGKVFRAVDIADGTVVALKMLHQKWTEDPEAVARFYREARLLAELDNPHIARFIEVNEDRGIHFLVMEFVEGDSLEGRLKQAGPLDEAEALSIVRDIGTALADVHDLGAVHRDVKPANILMVARPEQDELAKLCDFGVARSVEPTDEELTSVGMAVGTPHYMSPEQCVGQDVGPATDVYALGITLFKMLTGSVPFNASDARAIIFKHIGEPVPDTRDKRPDVSETTQKLIERMLEKRQEDRIPDARALLEKLDEVRHGGPTDIELHPVLPETGEAVRSYDFHWDLRSSPERLWPHVSNTERLNRAIGLEAVSYSRDYDQDDVATYGRVKVSGMLLDWREYAYEWVAPKRMGILRDFSAGPFQWMRSTVVLEPLAEGTRLHHRIDVLPRGVLGRAATAMEIGFKARRNLEQVYQRIDAFCTAESGSQALTDPFESPAALERVRAQRVVTARDQICNRGVDPIVVDELCRHVGQASPQEAARIRPRAFARERNLDDGEVLLACLHATHEGLLELLWDVICPRCQIPSNIVESLAQLRDHDRCEACAMDFELDFGRSVEVIFRVHPSIRDSELGVYCIGGPGHTPHVLVQVRLAPGERFETNLELAEGNYRVAGRRVATTFGFSVEEGAPLTAWEVDLGRGEAPRANRVLGSRYQHIVLNNATDREVVARIEKRSGRQDAATAAEVACMPLFRELFPRQVVAPGQLIGVGRVTLLLVELVNAWQTRAEVEVFGALNELKERAGAVAEKEAGSVVKLHGDGVLIAFDEPLGAIRTGLALLREDEDNHLCAAAHSGSAMATSINDRLDYFGRVVRELDTLGRAADAGHFAIAESLHADPGAAAVLGRERQNAPVVNAHGVVAILVRP